LTNKKPEESQILGGKTSAKVKDSLVNMKIETISKDAKVTLKFIGKCSKDMVLKIEEADLQLRVFERDGLKFIWNITERDQKRSQLIIQMYFISELDVSNDSDLDALEVKVPKDLPIKMTNNSCILQRETT
jgi:hypothetical protein